MGVLGTLCIALLAIGLPIGIALAGSALLYILFDPMLGPGTIFNAFFSFVSKYTLMAIPFFIFAGFLMERTGLIAKLFKFADALIGWLPGGFGFATLMAAVLFGAISGSSTAMAAAMGVIAYPELRKLRWQAHLRAGGVQREPNDGHRALVTLEKQGKLQTLLTQNVDGLHHAAGSSPEIVVEIHGTTREVMCMGCGERAPIARALERVRAGEEDPNCRTCGGILKSATISFGQNLVPEDLMRAERAAHECDLMVAIGTTLTVTPIANVVPVAKQQGARVVILNADPTAMDDIADAVIRGSISQILPRIIAFDA